MDKRQFLSALGALKTQVVLCWAGMGSAHLHAQQPQAPAPRLDSNGRLRFGIDYDVVSWDPHRTGSTRDQDYLFPVYDRLVHMMPNAEYRAGLAESWKASADVKSFEFKLRRNVKFQDGSAFDASVVKSSIERGQNLPGSTVKGELSDIAAVAVVDPFTVRIDLTRPNSMLPAKLSGRGGVMISPQAISSPDLGTKPAGSGMFRLATYVRGSRAVYERWDGHWNAGAAKLAGLEIRYLQDAARVNALLAREIDMAAVPGPDVERVRAAGYAIDADPGYDFLYLLMNWEKAPLNNVKVRQAIHHAINRKGLVDAVENGQGQPSTQVVSPHAPEYDKALDAHYRFDPALAKKLLAESGVGDLTLNFLAFQGSDYNLRINQLVQGQLEAVGFKVNLRTVDRAQAPALLFGPGNVHGMAAPAGVFPRTLLGLDVWYSSTGRLNMAKKAAKEMDEAIANGYAATSQAEVAKWTARANRIAVEGGYNAMLYWTLSPLAMSQRIVGFRKAPVGFAEFHDVGMRA